MLDPVPATRPSTGLAVRCTRALLSPWSRFSLLVAVLLASAVTMLLFEPQRLLASGGWPPHLDGSAAAMLFGLAYGVCTVAFVPRPLLNLAAGALFGAQAGLAAALAGTVLGAGVSFLLGRVLGQDALRTLLRGKYLKAADGLLEAGTGSGRCSRCDSSPVCPSPRPTTARRPPAWATRRSCWPPGWAPSRTRPRTS